MDQGGAQVDQLKENGEIKVNTAVCASTKQEAAVTEPIPPGAQGQKTAAVWQGHSVIMSKSLRRETSNPSTLCDLLTWWAGRSGAGDDCCPESSSRSSKMPDGNG